MVKTAMRATFCVRGTWSCESSGIGKINKATSVAIFMDALKSQTALKLRQFPGSLRSQNLATGTQFTYPLTTAHVEYEATMAITM